MRSRPWLACLAVLVCAGVITWAGCQPATRTDDRTDADAALFGPVDLRIHPFTAIKDWDGDSRPDGIECLIELQDRFRDPTKATGTVLFELYEYEKGRPDHRGARLAFWRGSLLTLEEQRNRWNRISRTYSFQLAYPEIRLDHNYLLQVWFEHANRRLTSQIVFEEQIPGAGPTSQPAVTRPSTTQPTTTPATNPATPPIAPGTPGPNQPGPRTPAP